jgi:hypothetical protein
LDVFQESAKKVIEPRKLSNFSHGFSSTVIERIFWFGAIKIFPTKANKLLKVNELFSECVCPLEENRKYRKT